MNAQEHKAEAERLLSCDGVDTMIAALVHATLATIPDPVATYPKPLAPKCPEVAVGGIRCTLPPGHDSPHRMEES